MYIIFYIISVYVCIYIVIVYLLQIDVSLDYLLQSMAGKWGVMMQEMGQGLIVLQKVLQLES